MISSTHGWVCRLAPQPLPPSPPPRNGEGGAGTLTPLSLVLRGEGLGVRGSLCLAPTCSTTRAIALRRDYTTLALCSAAPRPRRSPPFHECLKENGRRTGRLWHRMGCLSLRPVIPTRLDQACPASEDNCPRAMPALRSARSYFKLKAELKMREGSAGQLSQPLCCISASSLTRRPTRIAQSE